MDGLYCKAIIAIGLCQKTYIFTSWVQILECFCFFQLWLVLLPKTRWNLSQRISCQLPTKPSPLVPPSTEWTVFLLDLKMMRVFLFNGRKRAHRWSTKQTKPISSWCFSEQTVVFSVEASCGKESEKIRPHTQHTTALQMANKLNLLRFLMIAKKDQILEPGKLGHRPSSANGSQTKKWFKSASGLEDWYENVSSRPFFQVSAHIYGQRK